MDGCDHDAASRNIPAVHDWWTQRNGQLRDYRARPHPRWGSHLVGVLQEEIRLACPKPTEPAPTTISVITNRGSSESVDRIGLGAVRRFRLWG